MAWTRTRWTRDGVSVRFPATRSPLAWRLARTAAWFAGHTLIAIAYVWGTPALADLVLGIDNPPSLWAGAALAVGAVAHAVFGLNASEPAMLTVAGDRLSLRHRGRHRVARLGELRDARVEEGTLTLQLEGRPDWVVDLDHAADTDALRDRLGHVRLAASRARTADRLGTAVAAREALHAVLERAPGAAAQAAHPQQR